MVVWPDIQIDTNREYSLCFVCGKKNPIGLKLDFEWDGKTARAEFTPTEFYQGWYGVVHGGIIICLLDESMAYAALFQGMNCITASMQVRLRRPVLIGEPLIITGSMTENKRRLVETKGKVSLRDGTPIAEATATQFVLNSKPGKTSAKGERTRSDVWKQG